jgi:hypothetical protein
MLASNANTPPKKKVPSILLEVQPDSPKIYSPKKKLQKRKSFTTKHRRSVSDLLLHTSVKTKL